MARPPVCKLMDYGKFKYESALKARESRKNQAQTVIKEIKLRPKIDPHDYGTKKGHVERFLKQGDKVKVTIMFRGREQSRPELGFKLLQRLASDVEELGFVESTPKQDGRNMIMVIGPHKRKTDAMAAAKAERATRTRGSGQDESARFAQADPELADAVTEAPSQDGAPVSEAPVSEAPVSEAPVSEAPASEAPASEAPASEAAASAETRPAPTRSTARSTATRPPATGPTAPAAAPASSGAAAASQAAPRPTAPPRPQPRPGAGSGSAAPKPGAGSASAAPRPTAPRTAASPAGRPGAGSAAPKPSAPRGTAAAARGTTSGSAAGRPVPSPRPVAADKAAKPSGAKASPESGDSES
jgi:translation initiation factor IF-3